MEIQHVRASLLGVIEPVAPKLKHVDRRRAVWTVQTADREIFMCADSSCMNEQFHVVYCGAEKFYLAWLHTGGYGILRSQMPADLKFSGIDVKFNECESNPVYLANVAVSTDSHGDRLRFNNGITRTYWLLAHRAKAFPVQVNNAGLAEALHRIVGIGPAPLSFSSLFAASS